MGEITSYSTRVPWLGLFLASPNLAKAPAIVVFAESPFWTTQHALGYHFLGNLYSFSISWKNPSDRNFSVESNVAGPGAIKIPRSRLPLWLP